MLLAHACRKVLSTSRVYLDSFAEWHRLLILLLQGRLIELMSGGVNPAPAPTSYRHLLGVPSTDDFIVAIDKVTLVQNPASDGSSKQDHR